jgi:putative DNA primase/helicase
MVYAERGVGKTYFALCVGYAVASGGEFLRWRAQKPQRVLYLDGEMPAVTIQERLAGIVRGSYSEPPGADYFRLVTPDLQPGALIDLTQPSSWAALEPLVEATDLIIVDNISTLTTGDESEAGDWRPVQDWALRQRRMGRSVLLVHQAGKGGQQRGTSKREDVLDTTIVLRWPKDYQPEQGARFEVHFDKHRGFHGDDARPFEASLSTTDTNGFSWTVKSLDECMTERVAAMIAEDESQRDIAKALGVSASTVNRHAQKARAKGWLP